MATRILAGRYELLEKIGEGGMAVVFKAKDRLLSRSVAIKILRPEFTKDMMFIESFRRESQLAASIVDPNIVNVYDVGKEGNIYYIVMELVEGEPLSEIIKREAPLDPKRAASITRQIAMALSTAHKHQLIHRDVKPHNVLVTKGDVAKISDFGIAMKHNPEETENSQKKATVMGSIHYFSPEQARGAYVDERSDIYSLGIVLYEMLTGKVPFDGENAVEVALKHMNEPMTPPTRLNPDIPQDLEDIVMKATAKLQKDRYKNADEMITDLSFVKYSRGSDYAQKLQEDKTESDTPRETPEERKARIREEKKKARRKRIIMLSCIAAVVIAAIAIIVSAVKAEQERKRIENSVFPTPNVLGMNYQQAETLLAQYELTMEVEQKVSSREAAGTILSQSPQADFDIRPGQVVKVNISLGSTEDSVPSVTGETQSGAKAILEEFGYQIGNITGAVSSEAKGLVISQDPEPGSTLEKGGKVNIVVSLGPESPGEAGIKVTVPRLIQKTLAEATKEIEAAGLVLLSATEQESSTVSKGCVISQSLIAGASVDKGSSISIIVSSGAAEPKEVRLTVDVTEAWDDDFRISVMLSDGDNGARTIYEEDHVSKSEEYHTITIKGTGEASRIVVMFYYYSSQSFNTAAEYTVNFATGAVVQNET